MCSDSPFNLVGQYLPFLNPLHLNKTIQTSVEGILKLQRNDAKSTTIKFYVNAHAQGLESQRGQDKPTLMDLQPRFDIRQRCVKHLKEN